MTDYSAQCLADLYDQAKRQRDLAEETLTRVETERLEAWEAAETYWEAWQDASIYWKDKVKRLESELAETRQRMRSGWRLVEREGIDKPQPVIEE